MWGLHLGLGRATAVMDRDNPERLIASARALVDGHDYSRYYRRDGWEAHLSRESHLWQAGVGYRDMLERPLETTTTWNFTHKLPVVIPNLPAARGRAHELELDGSLRLPWLPVTTEVIHQTSGRAIGSDFEYRRTYAAMSGEFAV